MAFSYCRVPNCNWKSQDWPVHDLAGCEAAWHVYENHPVEWASLFGSMPPRDPDPRSVHAKNS